jgi:uncharacterized lipoprotein NlpE involved in copper resistance
MKSKFPGIVILFTVIAFVLVGCDNPADNSSSNGSVSGALNGTWTKGNVSIAINGSNYLMKIGGVNWGKGSITYSDGTIIFRSTHAWKEGSWDTFVETTRGTFTHNENNLTFHTCDNARYSNLVGLWTRQ